MEALKNGSILGVCLMAISNTPPQTPEYASQQKELHPLKPKKFHTPSNLRNYIHRHPFKSRWAHEPWVNVATEMRLGGGLHDDGIRLPTAIRSTMPADRDRFT